MLKGLARAVILILVFAVIAVFLWRCLSSAQTGEDTVENLPPGLSSIIPSTWTVLESESAPCDYDQDGESEWLVIYSYDPSSVQHPSALSHSLIGGVIYDSQVNLVPQEPAVQSPYRPAVLVPYKLLPDIYTAKGQGYLGESDIQIYRYPGGTGTACRAPEIAALGASLGTLPSTPPTYLSVFRWKDSQTGYQGVHYVGNARIELAEPTAPITGFVTYDRLNDRSALCAARSYTRPAAQEPDAQPPSLAFAEVAAEYTIDFCFGAPQDPFYPEGVVVALLRGRNPPAEPATPTGGSYLTPGAAATLPPEFASLAEPSRKPFAILSTTYPGTLGIVPAQGYPCPYREAAQPTPPDSRSSTPQPAAEGRTQWWCGREEAQVVTDLVTGDPQGGQRKVLWTLISMASSKSIGDLHWRVDRVELQP